MKLLSQAVLCVSAISIVACGSSSKPTKSKDDQAKDFFETRLNSAAHVECNEAGKFYDIIESKCLADVKLVSWRCAREGFESHIVWDDSVEGQFNKSLVEKLDEQIAAGYKFFECGESSDGLTSIQLVKKEVGDEKASIGMALMKFITLK